MQHLLRGVKLGWEFTPATAAAAASAAASMLPPATSTTAASESVAVSNGPFELKHQGLRRPEQEEDEVAQRKPTLLLLHGFMGSKVCLKARSNP